MARMAMIAVVCGGVCDDMAMCERGECRGCRGCRGCFRIEERQTVSFLHTVEKF